MSDFIGELGAVALGSRLKRLSDEFVQQAQEVYENSHLEFEPRWFPLFRLIGERDSITIGEAASLLGVTQPAVSLFAKQLEKEELVVSTTGLVDRRQKLLRLSDKGKNLFDEMRSLWFKVERVAEELINETEVNFLKAIENLETNLKKKSMSERIKEISKVEIIPYRPEHAQVFKEINYEWISKMFKVEKQDEITLSNPEKYFLQKNGFILLAQNYQNEIIGTSALAETHLGEMELSKMAVTEKARGLGAGEKLLLATIEKARSLGHPKIFLLTNKNCKAAIHIYKKFGFKENAAYLKKYDVYDRADYAMELKLK